MRPHRVVVGTEPVEVCLELGDRLGRPLAGEEALERLVKPLDLAASLGMVGTRVHRADPEPRGLELDRAPSTARSRREHRSVVGEKGCRQAVDRSGSVEARNDIAALKTTSASEAINNRE